MIDFTIAWTVFIAVFFIWTIVAIFAKIITVKYIWLASVIFLYTFCCLTDRIIFPFHNWKHYHLPPQLHIHFVDVRLLDEFGIEHPFDDRILPDDLLSVSVNEKLLQELISGEVHSIKVLKKVISKANKFRKSDIPLLDRFRHSVTRHRRLRWGEDEKKTIGEIIGIKIYNVSVILSEDSREVLNYAEELKHEIIVH